MREEREGYSPLRLLLFFAGGAAVGALATWLTAPRSGVETREMLRGTARDTRDRAARIPPAIRHAYSSAAEAARTAFTETYRAQARES